MKENREKNLIKREIESVIRVREKEKERETEGGEGGNKGRGIRRER